MKKIILATWLMISPAFAQTAPQPAAPATTEPTPSRNSLCNDIPYWISQGQAQIRILYDEWRRTARDPYAKSASIQAIALLINNHIALFDTLKCSNQEAISRAYRG